MHFIKERIGKLIDDLGGLIYPESVPVEQPGGAGSVRLGAV